jgi:hypothetical protein
MQRKSSFLAAAVLLAALFVPAMISQAHARDRHPAYIHALADLRLARGYLAKLTPDEHLDAEQQQAVAEIDRAISDIKQASIDDGKRLDEHAPVDVRMQKHDRFSRAKEALDAALNDVAHEEDDPATRDLQKRTIDHIHRAFNLVQTIYLRGH